MKTFKMIFITVLLSLLTVTTNAQKFADYAVKNIYVGKTAKPIITKKHSYFRTRILDASKMPVNFAGKYILNTFGCGGDCLVVYLQNAETGKVLNFPYSICCTNFLEGKFKNANKVNFKIDSRLIVFVGSKNEADESGIYYYLVENDKIRLIKSETIK